MPRKDRKHDRHRRRPSKHEKFLERPRADDYERITEFLTRQGEKSIAAEILNFLSENENEKFRSRTIGEKLGYGASEDLPGFWHVLHKLHDEGALDKDMEKKYSLAAHVAESGVEPLLLAHQTTGFFTKKEPEPEKPKFEKGKLYIGKITTHQSGYGFVRVDGYDEDIFIPSEFILGILDGDKVEILITRSPLDAAKSESWSRRYEGKIAQLIERGRTELVGTLKRSNKNFAFTPDNQRILPEIFVKLKDAGVASDGDKVVIHKLAFVDETEMSAKVKDLLGKAGESRTEVMSIARALGIDETFPKEVVNEANQFSARIPEDEIQRRIDFRKKLVFTIDPFDAKDFDDALSFEKTENGEYLIGVHIADVSHFVREGTELDEEALRRSTSVYLVDRVIPMLPSNLSENICSLVPKEDRLAYSVLFRLDSQAKVLSYEIAKTVIHSQRRFTYEEVQQRLNSGEGDLVSELNELNALAKHLMRKRFNEGAIDFETEEVKFKLDKDGKPIEVVRKVRLDSHRLIEEFMLLANRTVAKHVSSNFQTKELGYPSVYRIHDSPVPEKIKTLSEFVRKLGFHLDLKKNALNNNTASSAAMRKLLNEVKGSPAEFIVTEIALRCMAKAIYSDKNIGHYGLAFDYYSHFTSPIRRYPDLIFHRLLFEYEELRKAKKKESKVRLRKLQQSIPEICKHASEQERNATEAERDSIKLKQVEFITEHVGSVYDGVISGVTEFGIYVKLDEIGIEGLVHIKNLRDDYYEFDDRSYSLVGKRNHRKLQLGRKVKIKVHSVDQKRRTIDFLLAN